MEYKIKDVGIAVVDKKTLSCDFSIGVDQFFARFGHIAPADLPKDLVKEAITKKRTDVKLGRKDQKPLDEFFTQVRSTADRMKPGTQTGFSSSEGAERAEAEAMKSQGGSSRTIQYDDRDPSTKGIDTYDKATGKKEGVIILGPKGAVGELVPIEIIEKIETHYDFNGESDIEDDRKSSGLFKITNPSETDKIWDIDITLKKDKPATIDDKIAIKNLNPGKEEIIEYEIEEFEPPALKITEFISTQNNEALETYSLSTSEANRILFRLTAKNTKDFDLIGMKVKKEIPEGYGNVDVLRTSAGNAKIVDKFVEWTIDTLAPNGEATISLNMSIEVSSAEEKINTGKVFVEYSANKALTGIEFDKFDAYSNNLVGMEVYQQDDNPDMYSCRVIFENESDFQMQLVNLDVVNALTNKERLDIDPNEIPPIASGARWESVTWETETENGEEPKFFKTVEFFLISERKISTMCAITIDDIELAVALMAGKLNYSVSSIMSFRESPFEVLHQVRNTGGADLNEIIIEETLQAGYLPPELEKIELYVVRPPEEYDHEGFDAEEDIDWEDLGEEIAIDPSYVEITPADATSENSHVVRITLSDLRDSAMGMFLPGMIIKAKYTITADKPARETEFVSDVKYFGNTYPKGAAILIEPETFTIPVIHDRTKIRKGKRISAMAAEGEYEIVLRLKNAGESTLTNVELRDVVPDNFEYGEESMETSSVDSLEGKDMLVWVIEELGAGETIEVTYKITGTGEDYKASEAQLSV